MKNELSCQIVRDILPIYIDKLTGDETNAAVESHLEGCEECRKVLRDMEERVEPDDPKREQDEKTIDYFKQVRRNFKNAVIATIVTVLIFSAGLYGFRKYFSSSEVPFGLVNIEDMEVDGGSVTIEGTLRNPELGVTGINFTESEGCLSLEIKASSKILTRDYNFNYSYISETPIEEIWYGPYCLWDKGMAINSQVAAIFAARHEYIGDMPANGESSAALGIKKCFGPFINVLHTDAAPYSWDLEFEEEFKAENKPINLYYMGYFGTMLIGSVDNLSNVNFIYEMEGEKRTYSVSEEFADSITRNALGEGVKKLCSSPSGMQRLVDWFRFESSKYSQILPVEGVPVIPF